MENKAYILRNPKADDIFLMFRILTKVGVKNIKSCFESAEVKNAMKVLAVNSGKQSEAELSSVGMLVAVDVACVIMEHLDSAKDDIYAFLGRLSDMKANEIAAMNAGDFAEMLVDVIKLEGFRDFFMRVITLFK